MGLTMNNYVEDAFIWTMRWEGGADISDHPDDPGGRTRFGVTERDYPELWEDGPPTREEAMQVFENDYFRHERVKAHKVEDRRLAIYLADIAFNQGPQKAGTVLQRACNLYGEDIRVDGWVGEKTLRAVGNVEAERLLHGMVYFRSEHHVSLATSQERFQSFVYGWLRRDHAILTGEEP